MRLILSPVHFHPPARPNTPYDTRIPQPVPNLRNTLYKKAALIGAGDIWRVTSPTRLLASPVIPGRYSNEVTSALHLPIAGAIADVSSATLNCEDAQRQPDLAEKRR